MRQRRLGRRGVRLGRGRRPPRCPARPPRAGRPAAGRVEGPDDINGDGHRDLVLPVSRSSGDDPSQAVDDRVAVVYGSAKGLDPRRARSTTGATWACPNRRKAPPRRAACPPPTWSPPTWTATASPTSPRPSPASGSRREPLAPSSAPYVAWGGPGGPSGTRRPGCGCPRAWRTWAWARWCAATSTGTDTTISRRRRRTRRPWSCCTGRSPGPGPRHAPTPPCRTRTARSPRTTSPLRQPRATSLLAYGISDGEQTAATLYTARRGSALSADGRELRAGNAHAFGDFDGDGERDVAVGDDGGRNDEPGEETEAADVAGSLAVYPARAGSR
ncbi:hypothetical protein NKH77_01985 [Streptomyces sp. M19]